MKHTKKKRIETMFDQNLVPNVLLYKFRERFSPDAGDWYQSTYLSN